MAWHRPSSIYVGTGSADLFRMGFLSFNWSGWGPLPFSVATTGTFDSNLDLTAVNQPTDFSGGAHVEFGLSRTAGVYAVSFKNLSTGYSRSHVVPVQPTHLNGKTNLQAGVFVASTNNTQFTAQLDNFTATVVATPVPEPTSYVLMSAGLLVLAAGLRRRRLTQP